MGGCRRRRGRRRLGNKVLRHFVLSTSTCLKYSCGNFEACKHIINVYNCMLFFAILLCSFMFRSCGADGGCDGENSFDIGSREPMQFTGAEFHAYENAWSVHFQPPLVSAVLVFAICREPCLHAWQGYRILQCSQLLSILHEVHWYNAYVDSLDNNTESFCESLRFAPDSVTQAAGNILHDSAGGSLVRLRPLHTLVIFNQQAVLDEWMLESAGELSVSLRATQIEAHGELFGVQNLCTQCACSRQHKEQISCTGD